MARESMLLTCIADDINEQSTNNKSAYLIMQIMEITISVFNRPCVWSNSYFYYVHLKNRNEQIENTIKNTFPFEFKISSQ